MTDTTPVLLVDLSSIGHPIWHVSGAEPDPDYTSQRTAAIVRQLAADHPHTAICCDAPGPSFRKDVDPTYKANRPQQEAALYHQIDLAREALEADGFPVWQVDGFEGDDLIATATAELTAETWEQDSRLPDYGHGRSVLIASADKDLLALVSDRVEVHNTLTGNRMGPAEVREKLGVDPCQVVDYLTLVGDASDNIKGAKGIGPKTAVAMLGIFGNLDDLYRAIDDGSAGLTPTQVASLTELQRRLTKVRALVTMRTDVPMDVAAVFEPRVPKSAETFMEEGEEMDDPTTKKLLVDFVAATGRQMVKDGEEMGNREEPERPQPTGTPTGTTPVPEVVLGQLFPRPTHDPPVPRQLPPPPPKPEALKPEPTALAPIVEQAPDEWERGLEPRCMADAVRLAQRMHDSHMFSGYGNGPAVLSTILLGRELGIPAMAALRSVHLIEGKHSLSADLMVALVLRSGMAEYFQMSESTAELCTYVTKRKGNPLPTSLSYTIEQAKQAGLLAPTRSGKPSNWQKIPKQMLRARAKSELARLEYPDLLAGLYTPEELRDAVEA